MATWGDYMATLGGLYGNLGGLYGNFGRIIWQPGGIIWQLWGDYMATWWDYMATLGGLYGNFGRCRYVRTAHFWPSPSPFLLLCSRVAPEDLGVIYVTIVVQLFAVFQGSSRGFMSSRVAPDDLCLPG